MKFATLLLFSALLCAESAPLAVNLATAKWIHQKDGADSVVLREDDSATEYLVRYPAGHIFRPHWHSVNERVVLLEGRLSLQQDAGPETFLDAGGFAFLPAKQVQHTKCVSTTRCTFYVYWDGKLDFNPE
jgi:anti-sigma factor ChrR (cupin superfamily)